MFQPLFPVIALGTARFLELSWSCSRAEPRASTRASRGATALLCVTCLASSWVWQPVRFVALAPNAPLYRTAQAVALCALTVAGVFAAALVWRKQRRAVPATDLESATV